MRSEAEQGPSAKMYIVITIALLLLLIMTYSLAQAGLGPFWHPFTAYTIALAKALLIILFFMHIRYSHRLLWIMAGAGFFWLAILMTLTLADVLSRGWIYE